MKEITYFYLESCPYCRRADAMIAGIVKDRSELGAVKLRRVEESRDPETAGSYDYWYVPCLFVGKKKLHEGAPTRESLEKALEYAANA